MGGFGDVRNFGILAASGIEFITLDQKDVHTLTGKLKGLIISVICLFRLSVTKVFHFGRIKRDVMRTAIKVSNTFFIILTLILLATGGTMAFLDIEENTIRLATLWISVCIYTVHLLRKLQIFNSSCSVFTAFLYLCALEIIPTGTLVVSALIF